MYNLIIIGSGPAGYSSAIYAQRASLKPLLISGTNVGGQLMQTIEVDNYPGSFGLSGPELMEVMKKQVEVLGVKSVLDNVISVSKDNKNLYTIKTETGKSYISKAVIISTGSSAKWLNVKGEEEFKGLGVSACATCDGSFFENQIVAVIGGGNTAVEEAIYLSNIAKKVYLIHRRDKLRAEHIMQDKLFSLKNVEFIWDTKVKEIIGDKSLHKVTHVILENIQNKKTSNIALDGVFVAIGHTPNTDFVKNMLDTDDYGYIKTQNNGSQVLYNGKPQLGLYAAGDVKDSIYRQAITSAGSGCMAALDVLHYLRSL